MLILNSENYDYIFLIVCIISVIISLFRGGIREILSITTWVVSFIITQKYCYIIAQKIPYNISNKFIKIIIIYFFIFIIIAILVAIINKITNSILNSIGLGSVDYLIAIIFGVIRGLFIYAIFLLIIEAFHIDEQHNWQQTKSYLLIKPILHIVTNSVSQIKDIDKLTH
jgi:membrane protein required for colicin V production